MRSDNSTRLSRRGLIVGSAAALGISLIRPALAAEALVVVVHPSNRETPSTADLAAMFTTRKQAWGNGQRVIPFNFPAKNSVRIAFDKAILDMDPDDVARYWIDRRIRGGNAPPKQVSSAQTIARLVEKMEGAVAYLPKSALTKDVRVVREI